MQIQIFDVSVTSENNIKTVPKKKNCEFPYKYFHYHKYYFHTGLLGCNNSFHCHPNGFDNQLSAPKRSLTISRRNGPTIYTLDTNISELGRTIISKYGNVFWRL